jgi:hypothetical protein
MPESSTFTTACVVTAEAARAWYQVILETPAESPARVAPVEYFSALVALLFGSVPVETLRRVRTWAQAHTGITLSPMTHDHDVLAVEAVMLDRLFPPATPSVPAALTPDDLAQARIGLASGTAAAIRLARACPEPSAERSALRQASVAGSRALCAVYPVDVVTAAHHEARRQLELRQPPAGERVPISGLDAEHYSATLVTYLLSFGDEPILTPEAPS